MKPVRKVCHTMWGWTLNGGAWSLWSEIRRHVNVMDGYLTIGCVMYYVPWCYGLTSARNEQPAGKPLLQHCRSMGLWCDQGKLLPWASTYWQSDRVSPWGAPFTVAICRVSWPLLENAPLMMSLSLFCFGWWKKTAGLSPKWQYGMRWHHMGLCEPCSCNYEHQRKGFETAMWVLHTQFHMCSKIKE